MQGNSSNSSHDRKQTFKGSDFDGSEVITELLNYRGERPVTPPLLVLGQFERVGSTFYCDQLEKSHLVHNEPYKLLLPPQLPIARDYKGQLATIDAFFSNSDIKAVDKHWLRNFVAALHNPGKQVVKETNLYLALPQFLSLFPYSDIELLTRNPLGIVASFKRNNLYHRWHYAEVADTLKIQIELSQPDGHEALQHMLSQGDTWETKLAWMIGLNAVLLSRYVKPERVKKVITYEEDIISLSTPETVVHDRVQDSIFGTNIYKTEDDFESRFTPKEIEALVKAMSDCTSFVRHAFAPEELHWFDQLYARHLDKEYSGKARQSSRVRGRVSKATEALPQSAITASPQSINNSRKLIRLHEALPVLWDYSLVTNKQMGDFLQDMINKGQDPSLNYLLILDNMPPTRGGRITFDAQLGAYKATEGFDDHPVYWVSWLAASLYAYREGMRLPAYSEWEKVYGDKYDPAEHLDANHTYANDDTTPTGKGDARLPDDFFGNLKIWCSDWSNEQAVNKRLAGISWKHYFHDSYSTKAERPYLTNARWIGVRLVCCSECPLPKSRSMNDVINKFNQIIELIESTNVKTVDDLSRLNERIAQLITPLACKHRGE